jgi:hypothetical protein
VTLQARIRTLVGITSQTEVYHLQRVADQWLIDPLEVRDEVAPGEDKALACVRSALPP